MFGKLKKNKNDQYKVRNLYKIKTTSLFYIYAFNLNFVGFNYMKEDLKRNCTVLSNSKARNTYHSVEVNSSIATLHKVKFGIISVDILYTFETAFCIKCNHTDSIRIVSDCIGTLHWINSRKELLWKSDFLKSTPFTHIQYKDAKLWMSWHGRVL